METYKRSLLVKQSFNCIGDMHTDNSFLIRAACYSTLATNALKVLCLESKVRTSSTCYKHYSQCYHGFGNLIMALNYHHAIS